MTKKQSLLALLANLVAVGVVSGLSALLSREGMQRYQTVQKPPLSPPGIVCPIVWSILFLLMAVSAWLVLRKLTETFSIKGALCSSALLIYGAQLLVNFFWPIFFFRFGWNLFSLLWLLLLLYLVVRMIRAFRRIDPLAGNLQIPYVLWLCFAAYLNAGVWFLSR